jgi:hypothetical protein
MIRKILYENTLNAGYELCTASVSMWGKLNICANSQDFNPSFPIQNIGNITLLS